MLRLSPRTITLTLLLFFCSLMGIRHLAFVMRNPDASTLGRYLISLLRSDGREKSEAIESLWWKAETLSGATSALDFLERVDYDAHLRSHDPGTPHPDVAIVEVNEKSLRELGQFPFSRSVYKTLIQRLETAGAKVVGFDITFPEEERSALKQMQQMQQELTLREGFDSPAVRYFTEKVNALDIDEALANALSVSKIPVVLGFAFSDARRLNDEAEKEVDSRARKVFESYDIKTIGVEEIRQGKRFTSVANKTNQIPIVSIDKLVGALSPSSSIGNFAVSPDADGLIRRVPVVVQYDNFVLGSLGLRALASYFGEEPMLDARGKDLTIQGMVRDAQGNWAKGNLFLPMMPNGEAALRFYYEEGHSLFPYTEFSDIVTGLIKDEDLKKGFQGKIVFVGVTAHGLKDIRGTPYTSVFPGVESHATLVSNALTKHFLLKNLSYYWVGYLFTLVCCLFISFVVYRYHPLVSFLSMLVMAAAMHAITVYSFNRGFVIPSLLPILAGLTVFVSGVVYRYLTEERERRKVRSVFSRYVSSEVVEDILNDPTQLERLTGMKKELTVMFVDLVGFTKLTEHMDVALVTQLLNEYFSRMTAVIFKNQGTLDKFMGDSIMCFWGAPRDTKEHARLACQAALDIQRELARINNEWRTKHGISLGQRIGVHTGPMAVGNMGTSRRVSYTVLGDNVNLGSRLEGVNTVYGTEIVVSAATAEQAGASFLFRPLDRVQVKGKEDAVDILELVSEQADKEPEWVHAFRVGLKHYQAGEWNDAESAFGACLSLKPGDGPSQVFVDRIRDFRIMEPDEWSGVWKLASK